MKYLTTTLVLVALLSLALLGFKTSPRPAEAKAEKKFIEVTVGNYLVFHGYDANNKEVEEYVTHQPKKKKLISVDRIQSVSEKYILTTYAYNRIIYWEYEGGYEQLKQQLGQ